MKRSTTNAAIIAIVAIAIGARIGDADLENQVFTSKSARLRIVVPRGWRATDQPSYPGLLLWMMRSQPEGRIVLTFEPLTHELYCSWPDKCRLSKDPLASRMACALREKLHDTYGMHVGPIQAGPKENEEAGLPSVWIEYDDGRHFLRHAIAFDEDRAAVSLVLSSPTSQARAAHVRAFEQALRTLHVLAQSEAGSADSTGSGDVGSAARGSDSAAAPRIDPIGPCTQK